MKVPLVHLLGGLLFISMYLLLYLLFIYLYICIYLFIALTDSLAHEDDDDKLLSTYNMVAG